MVGELFRICHPIIVYLPDTEKRISYSTIVDNEILLLIKTHIWLRDWTWDFTLLVEPEWKDTPCDYFTPVSLFVKIMIGKKFFYLREDAFNQHLSDKVLLDAY